MLFNSIFLLLLTNRSVRPKYGIKSTIDLIQGPKFNKYLGNLLQNK